ncbi:MAG: L-threonylcarbamoyladenylate synthase [Mollicutes bacterium]|nr:L-threonylcarbamoyladenylate synthase [Mollicutes bacterium]
MKTKYFDWKNNVDESELNKIKEILDNDGVIIFPTDTVYGIACNCFSEKAIKKIFDIKKRPENKPINVLSNNLDKIKLVSKNISEKEEFLINKYMPGALTIILDKNEKVSDILTAGLDTIGVRIPKNNISLRILENVSYPLATTSANISGDSAGIKISDFLKEFDGVVDAIIDGGETDLKVASTIVRVESGNKLKIIREGTLKIKEM